MSSHHQSRTNRPVSLVLALALAGLATLTLTACGKDESAAAAVAAANTQAELDPMEVKVSAEMATSFKTAAVTQSDVASVLEISGRIEANERKVTRIGAAVTGRVTDVLAETGDRVKLGQTLARVASPELTTAQLAYMRASATATLAERSAERARQLIAADVIGSAELQRRESEVQIARAELRAAGDQLKLMGLSSDALTRLRGQGSVAPNAAITASAAGIVIERQISQGQVAQPGDDPQRRHPRPDDGACGVPRRLSAPGGGKTLGHHGRQGPGTEYSQHSGYHPRVLGEESGKAFGEIRAD